MEKISYDKIKELFIKYNYLPTEDLIWRTYIGLMQSVGKRRSGQDVYSICLDGPAGAGKSSYAKTYKKILEEITGNNYEFVTYSCNTKTGKEEVFEDVKLSAAITQDATKLITPGFIAQAVELCNQGKKVILRIDEYDKAKPETDSYLLEFLQEGRISTSQSGEIKLEHPENLQVILCKNDFRSQLSAPLTRRLNFINLDYTTPQDMASIVSMNMKEQENSIKLLVLMLYSNIYKSKDDYTRIPAASEVMIAIDEADILTKGGAPKQYVYKNIINNLFKSQVDIATFTSGNKKNGKIDEDIENVKMAFNAESEEPFDKQALTIDLYEMYFKPLIDDLKEQAQLDLNQICSETNEFKSSSDFKLLPVEIGKKQQSKFDISPSWFVIGEVETTTADSDRLAKEGDEIKFDGPIFVYDDYFITIVKENLEKEKVNLTFLSNKPAIPTNILIKIRKLLEYISCSNYSFSFPLISQYKFNQYAEKQNGFYEYKTDINEFPIDQLFDDIKEVKLDSVKMKTGKIIEGKNVKMEDFGKGEKVILKTQKTNQSIKLDIMTDGLEKEVQNIIDIPFEKPIVISKGKSKTIHFDSDTMISMIEIRSKKKGTVKVSAFEPEKIVEMLNEKNIKEADTINESLLAEHEIQRKYHILKALDKAQKEYLSYFIDDEKIDAININEAISNCVDYCMKEDVLNENKTSFYDNSKTKYGSLTPNIRTYSLRMKK